MAEIAKIQTTGGGYSLRDEVARANKGYAVNNGKIPDSAMTDLCPVTITPKVDGYIVVIMITSGTWGYDGAGAELNVTCSDSSLRLINYMDGHVGNGNQIGRQMTSISFWGPCVAGKSYYFTGNLNLGSKLGNNPYINTFAFVI